MSDSPYTFDAPDADVILRAGSKEPKDFHVHKVVLAIASTVFRDMFTIPQPPQPAESGIAPPVIPITDPAGVFEIFLRLIYPIEPPVINSLQLVDQLFRVTEKYMASGVHAKLRPILLSPSFLKNDPIYVYIIAHRTNLDKEAKLTIPHTFNIDLIQDIPHNKLRAMTTEEYHTLLIQHSIRRDQIVKVVDEISRKKAGFGDGCRCFGELRREIRLQISRKPFVDRVILEKCVSFVRESVSAIPCNTRYCDLTLEGSPEFLSDLMGRINKM